jgi:hypothetical protein
MKRVFIIHGWEGSPESDWLPWLKSKLEKKGFKVFVPAMPNPNTPEIKSWLTTLKKAVGTPDKETYFVGHSVGCQTILRYLGKLPAKTKVGGAVFVAGWFSLTHAAMPDEESKEIAKPWLEIPIDFAKVSEKTKNMTAIFSDNDPYVPFEENKKLFGKFCSKIIVEKGKGHMNEESKTYELPSALNAVLELAKV